MFKSLRKVFGIYPGEGRLNFKFAKFSFFYALASNCIETLSDGLFLGKVGSEHLPTVYLCISLGLITISCLFLYLLRIVSPYRIILGVFSFGIAVLISIICSINLENLPNTYWYGVKIFSRMFFSVNIACAWTFIDQYHDLQDAKRVYSLYASAYFLGIVVSGSMINLLLDQWGYPALFSMALLSIAFGIRETYSIVHTIPPVHDDSMEGVFTGDRNSFSSMIKQFISSPYAITLIAMSLFMQLAYIVTEFSYMGTFSKAFQNPENQKLLAATSVSEFLGKCRSLISVGNILIGFFLYSRLVRRTGVKTTLMITPVVFLIVHSIWQVNDSVWIAILGLIAVDGVLFTIEDNSFNILTNAVPTKLKPKIRILNDSFFEPIGMLLSSTILFAFMQHSIFLGFFLSVICVIVAVILRRSYQKALFKNLNEHTVHFKRNIQQWFTKLSKREFRNIKKDVLRSLNTQDPTTQKLAIETILSIKDPKLLSRLYHYLKNVSDSVKLNALEVFEKTYIPQQDKWIDLFQNWYHKADSSSLQQKMHYTLAKMGLLDTESVIEDLDKPDLFKRAAAILTLKKSKMPTKQLADTSLHHTIALKELDLLLKDENAKDVCIGLEILSELQEENFIEKAFPFLEHGSLSVQRKAAWAIYKLANPTHAPLSQPLIETCAISTDSTVRFYCLQALGKMSNSTSVKDILSCSIHFRPKEKRLTEKIIYNMGLKTVPILLSMIGDTSLQDHSRILSAKILSRLSLAQLQSILPELFETEISRAYFYFYFATEIEKLYPEHDVSLVKGVLKTKLESVINFIIHLLGAIGSIDDSEQLVHALRSRNDKTHSNAIESLERTCSAKTFRWIRPLIDHIPIEDKLDACRKYLGEYPELSLSELLQKLEDSPSYIEKVIATKFKAQFEIPNWRETLREKMKTSDESFHHLAYELLEI